MSRAVVTIERSQFFGLCWCGIGTGPLFILTMVILRVWSMTEQQLVTWFAVHPFTRTVTLMALTAVVIKVKQDFEDYRKALAENPDTPYMVLEMVKKCAWGTVTVGVLAVVPTLIAEVFKILGGGVVP